MHDKDGVLLLDADATTLLATGIARDSRIAMPLSRMWADRRRLPVRKMFSLSEGGTPVVVGAMPSSNGVLFVVLCSGRAGALGALDDILARLGRMCATAEGSDATDGHPGSASDTGGDGNGDGGARYDLDHIVGDSVAVRRLKADILRIAPLDVPVLLIGESGTGKEMVAHAIHRLSGRCGKPMVLLNAAAMPPSLVESELFGYEGGAFTGADRKGRKGKFEAADMGTLFLDEIGDMPVDTQVKLLRVLQDGRFERLGDDRPRHSDFRLISASHRDFRSMIAATQFRLDLFYRISAVTLRVPPLRERADDIPALVDTFLASFAARHRVARKRVHAGALAWLASMDWPGNIRQLQHAVERAAIFGDGTVLDVHDFRHLDDWAAPSLPAEPDGAPRIAGPRVIREAQSRLETELILRAMQSTGGNKKRAAAALGISRSYLYKRLDQIAAA